MQKNIVELVKLNIKAQINKEYVAPIVLVASPGVGKTTVIKNMVKDLKMKIVNVSFASLSIEQLSGLPTDLPAPLMDKYDTLALGNTMATQWSVPAMIHQANMLAQDSEVILLLDDMHEANPSVRSYLYELLLERKLGSYKLADTVAIIGTMNGSEEANFNGMSSAVRNRIAILKVETDFDVFMKDIGNNFFYYVSSFLKSYPKFLIEEESTSIEGFASPRSWDFLSNTIKDMDNKLLLDNLQLIGEQYLSVTCADAFKSHATFLSELNFTDIIRTKKVVLISKLPITQQLVFFYLINEVHTIEDGTFIIDLINMNEDNNSFIGFLFGEFAIRFAASEKNKRDGIQIIFDKLFDNQFDQNKYTQKFSKKQIEAFRGIKFINRKNATDIAGKYLL